MNAVRSERMKGHWARLRKVAEILGVDKMIVQKHLSEISVEGIINNDADSIENGRKICIDNQPRLFEPSAPRSMAGAIKLAFWYIDKIGDVAIAEKAMRAAFYALRKADT